MQAHYREPEAQEIALEEVALSLSGQAEDDVDAEVHLDAQRVLDRLRHLLGVVVLEHASRPCASTSTS